MSKSGSNFENKRYDLLAFLSGNTTDNSNNGEISHTIQGDNQKRDAAYYNMKREERIQKDKNRSKNPQETFDYICTLLGIDSAVVKEIHIDSKGYKVDYVEQAKDGEKNYGIFNLLDLD